MFHIGMDMHKKFSRGEVIDEEGRPINKRVLFHHDQEKIRKYFSHIGQNGTVTLEATRNWYWLFELLEEEGIKGKACSSLKGPINSRGTN